VDGVVHDLNAAKAAAVEEDRFEDAARLRDQIK